MGCFPSKEKSLKEKSDSKATMSEYSPACCSIPPVVSKGYRPKGRYETIGGTKMYVTGPSDASKAIFVVYDIFGYFDQTVQGADLLAHSGRYQVFMPDFFDGNPAEMSWMAQGMEGPLGTFFGTTGNPETAVGKLPGLVDAIEKKYTSIKSWGILGFCWGGKIVSVVTSNKLCKFAAGAQCHPAMLDPNEAAGIEMPHLMIASHDEDAEVVKKFEEGLSVPKHFERFDDQVHGFMTARANLDDEKVKAEYEKAYRLVIAFFDKHV